MNAITKTETRGEIMENVLIRGDISKLTVEERGSYYNAVCTSLGLNPLTKPFEYITLNGKLRLYALKDCTDQLRSIHGISVTDLAESEREGVFIVKAKVSNGNRTDVSTGAVNIAGLKGEALANALMKAETKAKRRATLSICGLGLLDETEVEDIPDSTKAPVRDASPPREATVLVEQPKTKVADAIIDQPKTDGPHKIVGGTYETWTNSYIDAVLSSGDPSTVYAWIDANLAQLEKLAKGSPEHESKARAAAASHLAFLKKTEPKGTAEPADAFPGDAPMDAAEKPKTARGRPKGSGKTAPDFAKDYDSWLNWHLMRIAEMQDPESLESIFESLDQRWGEILAPDKELLMGARREAERRMEND
jgi:hypothetical protein